MTRWGESGDRFLHLCIVVDVSLHGSHWGGAPERVRVSGRQVWGEVPIVVVDSCPVPWMVAVSQVGVER